MMENVVFWHWWILAVVLITLEVVLPSTFFLWMGVAAGAVGLILWMGPAISWEWQLFLFAVLSVVSIAVSRWYLQKNPLKTDNEYLNRRSNTYIGRVFTLEEPIVDGVDKVSVDDSQWRISGADCDIGTRVKVVSADEAILFVEPE